MPRQSMLKYSHRNRTEPVPWPTTILERDLSKSLKAKYVDLPKMPVSVDLTMDAALEKLAKSGKESFRLQQLADAAIDKWVGAFQSSIDSVERKLPHSARKKRRTRSPS